MGLNILMLVKLRLKFSLRRNLNFMEITLFNSTFNTWFVCTVRR